MSTAPGLLPGVRRVVTGHSNGVAVVKSDVVIQLQQVCGRIEATELWWRRL